MALGWTCGGTQKSYLWNPVRVALLNEMSSTGAEIHVDCRYSRISKSDSSCTTVYWGLSMLFSAARTPTAATRAKASTKKHALEPIFTCNSPPKPPCTQKQLTQFMPSTHRHRHHNQSITLELAGHSGKNRLSKPKNKRDMSQKIIASAANLNSFQSSRSAEPTIPRTINVSHQGVHGA